MQVTLIASTYFDPFAARDAAGYQPHTDEFGYEGTEESADELAEFSGRACYQSWDRPNPKTATNEGYLANIIAQGHESVLEHASASFYVTGLSRSLLAELSRHRHLSFSVISQRYVRMDRADIVVPPAIAEHGFTQIVDEYSDPGSQDWDIRDEFTTAIQRSYEAYDEIVKTLVEKGLPRKKAYEAARSVLPNATEVKMVVTGNMRAWRDVLRKRYHVAADAEIAAFAEEILRQLREIAPNCFQDFPQEPFGSGPGSTSVVTDLGHSGSTDVPS